MHLPSITSAYLAILALLYTVLAVQVGRLRQRDRAAFGDNGSLAAAQRDPRACQLHRIRARSSR